MTIYIAEMFKQSMTSMKAYETEIAVFESLKDLEAAAHNAVKIYEYTDGNLTVLERKPVYKTVIKEVQEVDSYTIETSAVKP
jgi:hypothetical protein